MSNWPQESSPVMAGKPYRCPHDDGWVLFSEPPENSGRWFGYQCEVCGQRFAGNQGCLGVVSEEIETYNGFGPYEVQSEWCDLPLDHPGSHRKVFITGEIMEWPWPPAEARLRAGL